MKNINTALLTRYLEAQDTIKQLLNERQIYQDKIDTYNENIALTDDIIHKLGEISDKLVGWN